MKGPARGNVRLVTAAGLVVAGLLVLTLRVAIVGF